MIDHRDRRGEACRADATERGVVLTVVAHQLDAANEGDPPGQAFDH
jgi:hypothetical protein